MQRRAETKSSSTDLPEVNAKEEYGRLCALESYSVMDTSPEDSFDRLVQLAATHFNVPIALVSLLDESRQWFKAKLGLDVAQTPKKISFCKFTILSDEVFVILDALEHDTFCDADLVVGDPRIRFYAGAPLVTKEGFRLGSICLIDSKPRAQFTRGEEEDLLRFAKIVIDELELRKANLQLDREKTAAIIESKSKSSFLANMSHEIRTPLTAMLGMIELLKETNLSSEQFDSVKMLDNSSKTLRQLLSDILDLSKLEANKVNIERIPFDPSELMEEMVEFYCAMAASKGIELCLKYDPVPPSRKGKLLVGDPTRIRQVVWNLVSNAIKFTQHGSVIVHVKETPETAASAPMTLEFFVKDTGIGMKKESLETLFEPFTQESHDTTRLYGGTGLGLSIVKRLIGAMNGTVDVDSELGKGTAFHVKLPCHALESQLSVKAATTRRASSRMDPRRILVVEDSPMICRLMRRMLEKMSHIVTVCHDGDEALSVLQQNAFEVCFCDMSMPGITGLQFVQSVRAMSDAFKSRMPIAILTADTDGNNLAEYKTCGADDAFCKPIDWIELRNFIAQQPAYTARDPNALLLRDG